MFLVLKKFESLYLTLEQMVVCDAWFTWRDFETFKAREFKNFILVDQFWVDTKNIVKDLQPMYIILHLIKKEGSKIKLLYECMLQVGELLVKANILSTYRRYVLTQWEWFHRLINIVVFLFCIVYCGKNWVTFLQNCKKGGHHT